MPKITIEVTQQVEEHLRGLLHEGLHGNTLADVAERIITAAAERGDTGPPKLMLDVNTQTRWFLERPELRLYGERTEEVVAFLIQQQLGTLLVEGGILHHLLGQAPRGKPEPEAARRQKRRR